jgi:D-lactate dehydrogenase (cytochrome)
MSLSLVNGKLFKYDISLPLRDWYIVSESVMNGMISEGYTVLNGSSNCINNSNNNNNKHILKFYSFGHAGDGNLHLNILIENIIADNIEEKDIIIKNIQKLLDKYIEIEVNNRRGSITAEHGVGQLKINFLNNCKTNEEMNIIRKLKKAFDYNHIINRGKIVL